MCFDACCRADEVMNSSQEEPNPEKDKDPVETQDKDEDKGIEEKEKDKDEEKGVDIDKDKNEDKGTYDKPLDELSVTNGETASLDDSLIVCLAN